MSDQRDHDRIRACITKWSASPLTEDEGIPLLVACCTVAREEERAQAAELAIEDCTDAGARIAALILGGTVPCSSCGDPTTKERDPGDTLAGVRYCSDDCAYEANPIPEDTEPDHSEEPDEPIHLLPDLDPPDQHDAPGPGELPE